jgi:SOS-response transcriptional repressor LexA
MKNSKMKASEFGALIAARRKKLNLTQEELAKILGISAPFVGYIERGLRGASTKTIKGLESALQLPDNSLADIVIVKEKAQTVSIAEVKSYGSPELKILEADDVQTIRQYQKNLALWKKGLTSKKEASQFLWLLSKDTIRFAEGIPNGQVALHIADDSMTPEVRKGDVVIARLDEKPQNGDLVLAEIDDKVVVRLFKHACGAHTIQKIQCHDSASKQLATLTCAS